MSIGDMVYLLTMAAGIVYVLMPDRGVMSVEEYIKSHPKEFRK